MIYKSSIPLLRKYLHIDEEKPFIHGKKVTIRVRHFLDIQGFYLAKHHDSIDTFAALICPLSPSASTTAFFNTAPQACEGLEHDPDGKMFHLKSQFNKNDFYLSSRFPRKSSKSFTSLKFL